MKTSAIPMLLLCAGVASADEKRPVSKPLDAAFLRQYAETRGFMLGRPVKPKPTPDGKAVLFLRSEAKSPKQHLFEFDVATGKTKELLSPESLLKGAEENLTPEEKARRERQRVSAGGFADYQLSDDGKLILVSLSGKLFVVTRAGGAVKELATGKGTVLDPKFSPDGTMVGYVRDHDVCVCDLAKNQEIAVTKGGTVVKTHGLAEFVAQEEMDRYSGYWWSPDSKFIAYEEADHDGVEQWFVADPAKPDSPPLPQYYPRPGKKNVAVRLGIVPVKGGETVWVEWDRKKYEYLAAVRWDKLGPLTIQVQDRKQQELHLLRVDWKTGLTNTLLIEKDWTWVNLHQKLPRWLDEYRFYWASDGRPSSATRLYLIDSKTNSAVPRTPVTSTDVEFAELVHVDKENDGIAFLAYSGSSQVRPYVAPNAGKGDALTKSISDLPGVHSAIYSENSRLRVKTVTSLRMMPKCIVEDGLREKFLTEDLPSVACEPDFEPNVRIAWDRFYTAIVRPQNFDPKKKYPVINYVYGGPHHLTVVQAMKPWLLMQWLADQGFIVVAIDNRGTPGRGRDWERAIYQQFGTVPLEDQVAGLKLLGAKNPEMDMERIGVYGWSFGGYMAALSVLKQPDVFKAAVAGAPVTDWEDYDTHYTERYLGVLPESKKAYEGASLLPLAPKLTRPLLLVHGTADDNVYFRHTLRLTDALFRAGKDFEVLPLPSLTHMVPDPVVTERLWSRIGGHFKKHLGEMR